MNGSDALLTVAIEGLAVGIFTLIAGINDQAGSIVVTFMVGLWIIFMITNSGAISKIVGTAGNIGKLA